MSWGQEPYWALIEPYWERLPSFEDPEQVLKALRSIPNPAAHLFTVHCVDGLVCNGGFWEFFFCPTGMLAPEAVAAFEAIEMPNIASVVAEAVQWFPSPFPRDQSVRQELMEPICPKLEPFKALDDRYFELTEREAGGFLAAANRFARAHT